MKPTKGERLLVLSLRLITTALVLVPLAASYFSSGSLERFLMPGVKFSPPNVKFNVISYDFSEYGAGNYLLDLRLSNVGDVEFGLKSLEGKISLPDEGVSGRFSLEAPIAIAPGHEGELRIALLPDTGDFKTLGDALSRDAVVSISGEVTLTLGTAELPLEFSVDRLRLSEVIGRGEV